MLKILLIILGTVSLSLGIIGIATPGLPTTPFLLLSAACYLRSSEKLYIWVTNHKVFGKYIKTYHEKKAMTLKSKIISLSMMWSMILLSVVFFINNNIVRSVVLLAGLTGTAVILRIKTYKQDE
ncbi:MAG: YbaN family protein [Spirochaetes bacterium]|nr:YbaN family protein [Spirochaetota bacterium]